MSNTAYELGSASLSAMLACSRLSAIALFSFLSFLIWQWLLRLATTPSYEGNPLSDKAAPLVCSLPQHSWLFGLDVLYQDFRDLQHHNSSNRSLDRHNRHGQTYLSVRLGQSTIHTIDPANILAVTIDKFADYEKGDWARTIAKYMRRGILVNDGDAWHASRTLLKPLFRRNRAADVKMFEPHADRLVDYLKSQRKVFVDFKRAAQMVVLDVTTEMLTGRSAMSLASSITEARQKDSNDSTQGPALLDLIDELEPYGNTAIELGRFALPIFALRYRRIMALIRGIQGFFETAVGSMLLTRRRCGKEAGSEDANIIAELLAQGMTPHEVQGELQNILFAAFDTTAALLANLFDCLDRQPDIVQRLQAELALVVGTRPIAEADIARLTYLRASIFETLRLHSPVTYHTRTARTDTMLPRGGGLDGRSPAFVNRGTSVTWSTYAVNRQVRTYGEDWADFRPERWLMGGGLNPYAELVIQSKESFMPFGSGPRNCLGQQFAMLQTSYIAARLLVPFEHFRLRDGEVPFQEAAGVTHYNERGTWIEFQ